MLGQSESVKAFGTHTQLKQGKLYHSHHPRCNLQEFHQGCVQCGGTGTVYSHLLEEAEGSLLPASGGKHFCASGLLHQEESISVH